MTAKKSRKRAHRRRRRQVFTLLLLAVICAAVFVCVKIFFKIETITVSGDTRYSAEEVITASGLEAGQNIFTVSQKRLTEKITALCPYVEQVTVIRHLPGTLELSVTESDEVYAAVNSMGQVTMINSAGVVLEQRASLPEYTCLILGSDLSAYPAGEQLPEEWQEAIVTLDRVLAALDSAGMTTELGYADISDLMNLRIFIRDRALLTIGSEYEIETKLLTAKTVLDGELPESFTGTLNVSVQGRAYSKEVPISQLCDAQYLAIMNSGQ